MPNRYRYYCLYRPAGPGSVPRGLIDLKNFDDKQFVPEIGKEAWGWVEYEKPLTDKEIRDYELMEETEMKNDKICLFRNVYTPDKKYGALFLIDNHVCFVDVAGNEEQLNDEYYDDADVNEWSTFRFMKGSLISDGWSFA